MTFDQDLGERFIKFLAHSKDTHSKVHKAIVNTGSDVAMREDIQTAVNKFLDSQPRMSRTTISSQLQERLTDLAEVPCGSDFVCTGANIADPRGPLAERIANTPYNDALEGRIVRTRRTAKRSALIRTYQCDIDKNHRTADKAERVLSDFQELVGDRRIAEISPFQIEK